MEGQLCEEISLSHLGFLILQAFCLFLLLLLVRLVGFWFYTLLSAELHRLEVTLQSKAGPVQYVYLPTISP